jgi:S1-C subfamily serine protease
MKRTLIEILSGLAVLVLLASFHHQISRLKAQGQDVAELRGLVEATAATAGSRDEIRDLKRQLTAAVEARLATLEQRLADTTRSASEASALRQEIESTKREAALLKAEVTRDVSRTKELVDAYANELRAQGRNALENISETRSELKRLTGRLHPDASSLTQELLAPTVQLNGEDTVGSGTMIRSHRDARTGKAESWVLTSYHVVRNILTDSPRARHDGIPVTIFGNGSRSEVLADMVSHDEKIDAALLKLRSDETFERVARILPRDRLSDVRVWDDIYAIGCPLGNDPIPTFGAISSTQNVLNGTNYWMINAPTYYGNSGGGVFLAESRQLVGVFSKIYTHGRGNPVVIPHMGLCTPITAIYAWLEREKLSHVLSDPDAGAAVDPTANLAAPGK